MVSPASGAVLSGTASYLDASASDNMAVTRVEFRATGGSLSNQLLGTGSRTVYGWLFAWNTKTVANGSYTITSVAFDAAGNSTTGAGLNVSVAN